MRYTPEIEQRLIDQIEREPEREVILPDWAYWGDGDACVIYRDDLAIPLIRHLYEVLIQPLPDSVGLVNAPGVRARNVNPRLAVLLPSRHSRPQCKNGHPYIDEDYVAGVGYRCHICREAKHKGTPSVADLNSRKTHCPKGHPLTKGNLVKLKSGRRKCLTCHRENQARYRARKGTS